MVGRRPRYLLDTNVVSEPVRARPNPNLVERRKAHRDEVAVSATATNEVPGSCFWTANPSAAARRPGEPVVFSVGAPGRRPDVCAPWSAASGLGVAHCDAGIRGGGYRGVRAVPNASPSAAYLGVAAGGSGMGRPGGCRSICGIGVWRRLSSIFT